MMKRHLLGGILGAALLAGCATQHEKTYAGKQICPETGKEWLDGMMNRADNGYGSQHYYNAWETLRDHWASNGVMAEDAAARAQALMGARASFWQALPQAQPDATTLRP
jgi:nitrous oxide reductase accessory protein NosL